MIISVPLFFCAAFIWDDPMFRYIDMPVLFSLFYQGFVTASFGFVAWNTMLRRYGATTLNAFVFIMPVTGVTLGGAILGEPVSSRILGALILIAIGLVVVYRRA